MTPGNPVVGGSVLRRPAIQSPNFVQSPLQGWAINADGSAYFANITAEGSITSDTVVVGGTAGGVFAYSAAPAAGNLVATLTGAAGVDGFGNNYLEDTTSYGAASATQMDADGFISFYTGSLAAGWTPVATLQFTGLGVIVMSGGLETQNNVLDDGGGNANIAGALIVTGDVNSTGTACTLSGGASASIPTAAPSRTNLGSTWNATTASECNQNFVNIINALGSVGIFS